MPWSWRSSRKPGPGSASARPGWRRGATTTTRSCRLFFVRLDGPHGGKVLGQAYSKGEPPGCIPRGWTSSTGSGGRGIGLGALLRHAEALAAEDGRSTLQSFTEARARVRSGRAGNPQAGETGTAGSRPRLAKQIAVGGRLHPRKVTRFSALDMPPSDGVLDALEARKPTLPGTSTRFSAGRTAARMSTSKRWQCSCPE